MRITKSNFLEIVKQHEKILFKVSNAYCKDPDDRKDIIQEIIIQLWNSFHRYNPDYKISTWIYRIALNVAISHYRKESKRKNAFVEINEEIIHVAENEDRGVQTENDLDMLNEFINELDKLNKALILLYLDEYSHNEISEILGISSTNVATKINRIKKRLKNRFENQASYKN